MSEHQKSKGGRPVKPREDRLRHPIVVRLNDLELAELHFLSGENRKNYTGAIRALIVKRNLPAGKVPKINVQTHAELGKIGGNLNQIAKKVNQLGIIDAEELHYELIQLTVLLDEIKLQLVGVEEK
ncbi:MAG: plasmid mobilization relaxosome protein MobC [Marinospirillum sp.]|uniref:plasmid mobilization relaxosome protein MobC n=1 Tax=Marinospirillum sp. TaxID=2183934 RepID=UPI001A052B7A|nr:plasmid mobilization relaxosome protein MobC [Marinospirillum sp.]MBE0508384.1 plasmid mobilization relaxosome protein MobC [Marinospirillum sp.]